MCTLLRGGLLLVALCAGCAPMTFSKDASIDFLAYPSVSFQLGGPDGSERQSAYLQSELREHSGFRRVTQGSVAAFEPASAQLTVELSVRSSGGDDPLLAILTDDDDDDDEETSYSASVGYRLNATDGHVIDSGAESAENETTFNSAAESALDQLVFHYLRAYRL
jgi:hypothetical protein